MLHGVDQFMRSKSDLQDQSKLNDLTEFADRFFSMIIIII